MRRSPRKRITSRISGSGGLKDDRVFDLTLEKGAASKTIADVSSKIDLSLGDIPLEG